MNLPKSNAMVAARYVRIKEIFLRISALPTEGWEAALKRECADDIKLQKEVSSLLSHHQGASVLAAPVYREVHRGGDEPRIAPITFSSGGQLKWNEEQRRFLHQRIRFFTWVLHLLVAIVLFRA